MSKDLVTAVIATYNYGRFVTQAVESVLAQTYSNIEIIVVDDGSTTPVGVSPAVRRVRHEGNRGRGASVNAGLRAASHDVVLIIDG